jgi:hypothetical protein
MPSPLGTEYWVLFHDLQQAAKLVNWAAELSWQRSWSHSW